MILQFFKYGSTACTIAWISDRAIPTMSRALGRADDIGSDTKKLVEQIAPEISYLPKSCWSVTSQKSHQCYSVRYQGRYRCTAQCTQLATYSQRATWLIDDDAVVSVCAKRRSAPQEIANWPTYWQVPRRQHPTL